MQHSTATDSPSRGPKLAKRGTLVGLTESTNDSLAVDAGRLAALAARNRLTSSLQESLQEPVG
jgi:hypothetical protein